MIHWGIFTVPAWAETVIDPADWLTGTKLIEPPDFGRDWFTHIPYVEWYQNTILIPGSPAQQHHADTYGANVPYESFRPEFEAQAAAWSGESWASLFGESGARYVVLVTKHHDGFALWPTDVPHPTRPGWHFDRDVVGELSAAVRRRCMRMGLYYSGGFDWSVQPGPIQTSLDALTVAPQTPEYIAYADGQWRELIARYRPAVMWNDVGYPNAADELQLFADYYNAVPDGVINDRFTIIPTLTHYDYTTPEFSVVTDISPGKFETVRGMGRGFGYNRNEADADLASATTLIRLLVDVVSKNGNLLLNVGPLADGTVPTAQADRLRAIGAWLGVNGEAIFATRPWTRAEGLTADGTPVRFTQSADATTTYAIVTGALPPGAVSIAAIGVLPAEVRLLGGAAPLGASLVGADLRIEVPTGLADAAAYVFALRW
jgi:alpha-L-fucosidase